MKELLELQQENTYLNEKIVNLEYLVGEQQIELDKIEGAYIDLQNRVRDLEASIKVLVEYIKSQNNQTQIASQAEETPPPHY